MWLGTMKDSVRVRRLGDLDALVGVDGGVLVANEMNAVPTDYRKYVLHGHRKSPVIKFKGGIAARSFGKRSPNPFAEEALHYMPNFSDYYKVSGAL